MNRIDWSKSFSLPVSVKETASGVTFKAFDEEIVFKGNLLSVYSDCEAKAEIKYVQNGDEILYNPEIYADSHGIIKEYHYFDGEFENFDEICIAGTDFTGICAFVRKGKVSFYLSLDFPYSKIDFEGSKINIGCDPLDEISESKKYLPHSLTVGAARLTGVKRGNYDIGEIEAFSEYIRSRMPEHFRGEKPIFITTCITNRMTECREGRVFYSMYDNPTLTLDPETLKEEVRLCGELGIEYYQVFEGYFDWEKDGSSERALREIQEIAKPLGVRVGDYMTTLGLNCWHYNYHNRWIEDPEMCALPKEDYENNRDTRKSNRALCYGCKKTLDFLRKTIIESIKKNGEGMICLDGDAITPCYDAGHGHNPGSLYAIIKGLTEFMQDMNNTSEAFLTWSNAGNWLQLMPKLLWYNQNVYLTDPHARNYASSLNGLFYLGNVRREQMVTVHNKYFVPYSAYTNCEYYHCRHSRVDDEEFFEYSFLQGLAVTPNITLGEMRTFFERTSSKRLPYVKSFIKKWLSFIKENIDCWKNVYQLGDSPETGANEIYTHMNGDRGFICLVNQNQTTQSVTLSIDGSIGLAGKNGDRFLLSEIYPRECPISEQPVPGPLYGDAITLSVPAFSVRYIKVEPYTEPDFIRLYGVNGKSVISGICNTFKIKDDSGVTIPAAVWVKSDRGCGVQNVSIETEYNVPKYLFPSSVSDLKISGQGARFNIHMPRDRFFREISEWKIDGVGPFSIHQNNSDFCGAYIHNLYREPQTVYLSLSLGDVKCELDKGTAILTDTSESLPVPPSRRGHIYESKLNIPFIEWPGMSPRYGFDEVLELVFCDFRYVKKIRAFINGREMNVLEYSLPINWNMKSYYIELTNTVGSGTVSDLRIEVDWDENTHDTFFTEKKSKGGAQILGKTD